MGDGDDHVLFGDQILDRELALVAHDLGAAVVAELVRRPRSISSLRMAIRLGLDARMPFSSLIVAAHLLELGLQLLDLEPGELGEPHVEDRVALLLAEAEPLPEPGVGLRRVVRPADDLDHLVDVVDGDLEAFEDVLAGLAPRRGRTACAGR